MPHFYIGVCLLFFHCLFYYFDLGARYVYRTLIAARLWGGVGVFIWTQDTGALQPGPNRPTGNVCV
jgi:hypothetical protein